MSEVKKNNNNIDDGNFRDSTETPMEDEKDEKTPTLEKTASTAIYVPTANSPVPSSFQHPSPPKASNGHGVSSPLNIFEKETRSSSPRQSSPQSQFLVFHKAHQQNMPIFELESVTKHVTEQVTENRTTNLPHTTVTFPAEEQVLKYNSVHNSPHTHTVAFPQQKEANDLLLPSSHLQPTPGFTQPPQEKESDFTSDDDSFYLPSGITEDDDDIFEHRASNSDTESLLHLRKLKQLNLQQNSSRQQQTTIFKEPLRPMKNKSLAISIVMSQDNKKSNPWSNNSETTWDNSTSSYIGSANLVSRSSSSPTPTDDLINKAPNSLKISSSLTKLSDVAAPLTAGYVSDSNMLSKKIQLEQMQEKEQQLRKQQQKAQLVDIMRQRHPEYKDVNTLPSYNNVSSSDEAASPTKAKIKMQNKSETQGSELNLSDFNTDSADNSISIINNIKMTTYQQQLLQRERQKQMQHLKPHQRQSNSKNQSNMSVRSDQKYPRNLSRQQPQQQTSRHKNESSTHSQLPSTSIPFQAQVQQPPRGKSQNYLHKKLL